MNLVGTKLNGYTLTQKHKKRKTKNILCLQRSKPKLIRSFSTSKFVFVRMIRSHQNEYDTLTMSLFYFFRHTIFNFSPFERKRKHSLPNYNIMYDMHLYASPSIAINGDMETISRSKQIINQSL